MWRREEQGFPNVERNASSFQSAAYCAYNLKKELVILNVRLQTYTIILRAVLTIKALR
jgi:hypothetical protein